MRHELWIAGNPIPKGRPRYGGRSPRTPEATREWEEVVGWQARSQFMRAPLEGDLGIEFIFFRENQIRTDLDNLEKAMLDALQGILYEDDSQIREKSGRIRYHKEHSGVRVTVWETAR